MSDKYRTIQSRASAEFKEKGSKFISQIFPVQSREKAEEIVSSVKKDYHDATHNCSAFRVGIGDDAVYHYDDDGEPSGTAGQPIYQAIVGADLTDVLIVVTRYFGGTKLGTGGLIRAYGAAANRAIEDAKVITKYLAETLTIHTTYDDISQVMRVLDEVDGKILRQDYGEGIVLKVAVRKSLAPQFTRKLTDLTAGRIEIE